MRTNDEILQGADPFMFTNNCYFDFRLWGERVFGYELKDFHIEWMNLIHKNRFVVVKAFRGSGKTTVFGIIYPLWMCWYRPGTKILLTASELTQATKVLDEIKDTIEDNEYLKELMPPNPSTWKKTELKMTNNSHIMCKAFTRHIKGVHVNYAFVDEVQDCADREIYNRAIAPTVNQKKGKIVAVGASDYPGDLLDELSHRQDYIVKAYPIMRKPGVSMWPEKFSLDDVSSIRRRDGEASFQTQYMMNPNVELEGAVYNPDWVSNCFSFQERFQEKPIHDEGICMLGGDFAISKGAKADFDAYVVVEKISNKTIIRWGERHKGLSKDAKVQKIEELYSRYKPRRIILDPSNIGEAIIQDLRQKAYPVEAGEFHARARNKMLVNLATMIQPGKNGESQLVIPRNPECPMTLTFTSKLVEELIAFKEQKSQATGMTSIISKGAHDDTVMALALACKGASEQREFLDMVGI